jgi:hypothetical protein
VTAGVTSGGVRALGLSALLACLIAVAVAAPSSGASKVGSGSGKVGSSPGKTQIRKSRGKFVPIPDEVPHAEGTYIDKRIIPDLTYIARHFKVYVVEGFSGRLPSGKKVGCNCHVSDSEHKIGLAVDLIPLVRPRCDKTWHGITRLAHWAEPKQNQPQAPFRWVGYDGDEGHGCGNHLHLSWNHDPDYKKGRPSAWVETFR